MWWIWQWGREYCFYVIHSNTNHVEPWIGQDEYKSNEWTRILMTGVIRFGEILPFIVLCGVAIDSNFH